MASFPPVVRGLADCGERRGMLDAINLDDKRFRLPSREALKARIPERRLASLIVPSPPEMMTLRMPWFAASAASRVASFGL